MIVGIPKESLPGEARVALVPATIPALTKAGLTVVVERGAGTAAGYPDQQYTAKGAELASRADLFGRAEVILQVNGPAIDAEAGTALRSGQTTIAFHDPLSHPKALQELAGKGVRAVSMELIPRITRAQVMDALSSMATIAGYKAVLLAACELPRMFPMLMTAAGTLKPARVLIVGAGVAGLQAISAARRLGAKVEAYDVRPAVKEQIESLGAKFVELDLDAGETEDKGGYAKEQSEEFLRKQREEMGKVVARNDVVITTAAIPGRKAPVIVTAEMVRQMEPGSVIVDLAAERGGNCELTKAGQRVMDNGVLILGPENVPASIPYHASQMYSKNISALLLHFIKDAAFIVDMEDEIAAGTVLTDGGKVVHARLTELLGLQETTS